MSTDSRKFPARAGALILCCLLPALPAHAQQDRVDELVRDILHDVVDRTMETAREEVQKVTGVDLAQGGYASTREHQSLPRGASGEARRELRQLQQEHDREAAKLEDELHRKLEKARMEFRREAGKEDKPEKVRKKRHKLEEKVQAAYAKFNDKLDAVNRRFDRKRDRILSTERGGGRAEDGGRGAERGLDELTL